MPGGRRANLIDGAVIECTAADETRAAIVVRPRLAGALPAGTALAGVVRGPYSQQAHTLPAEFPLVATDNDALAATIIDPCYSTGELQMDYQIELALVQDHGRETVYRTRLELQRKT